MGWKGKNVLITGISGFVGSYLAKELIDKGAYVYGFIRKRSDFSKPVNLIEKGIVEEVKLIEGDLRNITSIARALDISQPEYIFHLAAQSYVPKSFEDPLETIEINTLGTANLLEAVRIKEFDPVIIFAGSSEEYGLVFSSFEHYERIKKKYGIIYPEPEKIPELPINENNPLRPMSPYAVSKVHGDFLMRNYFYAYGIKTIVSRAFNTEGAGRGSQFVTSVITKQAVELKLEKKKEIIIGNVNAFRDWSHVKDIVNGYLLLAEKGKYGEVYNQGSQRTNSVLTYILLSLEEVGFEISKIESIRNPEKHVINPTEMKKEKIFGLEFEVTTVDELMLNNRLEFSLEDKGIRVYTQKGEINIIFDEKRFRPAEVPILLANVEKIKKLGFKISYTLRDVIRDQINYFLEKNHRENFF